MRSAKVVHSVDDATGARTCADEPDRDDAQGAQDSGAVADAAKCAGGFLKYAPGRRHHPVGSGESGEKNRLVEHGWGRFRVQLAEKLRRPLGGENQRGHGGGSLGGDLTHEQGHDERSCVTGGQRQRAVRRGGRSR